METCQKRSAVIGGFLDPCRPRFNAVRAITECGDTQHNLKEDDHISFEGQATTRMFSTIPEALVATDSDGEIVMDSVSSSFASEGAIVTRVKFTTVFIVHEEYVISAWPDPLTLSLPSRSTVRSRVRVPRCWPSGLPYASVVMFSLQVYPLYMRLLDLS